MKFNMRSLLTVAGIAIAACVVAACLPAFGAAIGTLAAKIGGETIVGSLLFQTSNFIGATLAQTSLISSMASVGMGIVGPIASGMGALGFTAKAGVTPVIMGSAKLTATGAGLAAAVSTMLAGIIPQFTGGVGGMIDHVASNATSNARDKIQNYKQERTHQQNVAKTREQVATQLRRRNELKEASTPQPEQEAAQPNAAPHHAADGGHDFSYLGDQHPASQAEANGKSFTQDHQQNKIQTQQPSASPAM